MKLPMPNALLALSGREHQSLGFVRQAVAESSHLMSIGVRQYCAESELHPAAAGLEVMIAESALRPKNCKHALAIVQNTCKYLLA